MNHLPYLDSIIRFEGEETLLELLRDLDSPERWHEIQGLAFREKNTHVAVNAKRPLLENLDELPPLHRDEPQVMKGGIRGAAMLSSRGCLYNCSFCSIRQFYGGSKGALRRSRSPASVVEEMLSLFRHNEVRYFSFQDDDFAARSDSQRKWLDQFLAEVRTTEMFGNIAWKISCRVDDLEPKLLRRMQEHGLLAVYLGVESGNSIGLKALNKRVSVQQNYEAIDILKEHDVAMSIGFMLFDPSSTVETVRENIRFLDEVGRDGYFPVNFCKMLPYAGTPIEKSLKNEGRLTGKASQPNYMFSDPVLDWFEFLVQKVFSKRNFSGDGLVALLQSSEFDYRLGCHFSQSWADKKTGDVLGNIIKKANITATETLATLLDEVVACDIDALLEEKTRLMEIFENELRVEMECEVALKSLFAD